MTSNGLWWSRCVGICTDGCVGICTDGCVGICTDDANAMTGRHNGVVTHVQAVAPDATWVHCNIHREALAAKERNA